MSNSSRISKKKKTEIANDSLIKVIFRFALIVAN